MDQVQVFVLDRDTGDSKRRWAEIIPGSRELNWNQDRQVWQPERPRPGNVVVCHLLGNLDRAATDLLATEGVRIVIVSQSSSEPSSPAQNVYRRGAGVGRPTDETFSRLFLRFRQDLEENESPAWRLLEPDSRAVPEHVLACYLCALGGLSATEMPIEWQAGFENEVNYWVNEAAKGRGLALAWSQRNDIEALRAFLTRTQSLVEHQGNEATSNGR